MIFKRISEASVEILIGLLATGMIATGLLLYALDEPHRIDIAQAAQLDANLDQAMELYAQNCAVCHGAGGEGIGANPALDKAALRESDPGSITKIISRGLYNTAMPAWNIEDGGSLSDAQISLLVDLVRFGDWVSTTNVVSELGLTPLVPFSADPDPQVLAALSKIPGGEQLSAGITVYAEQCVACHGADGAGTSLAPALNDPLVRAKSPEEIERTILNGISGTLMAGWDQKLSSGQIDALIELIVRWEEVPSGAIPEPQDPLLVTEESLALGAELYAASCSGCHAPEGQGSQRAPALNVRSFLEETPDQAIQQIVTLGVPDTAMPAWGDRMSEGQIEAIVGFIRSWEPTAPEVASPIRVRGPWSSGASGALNLPSGGVNSNPNGKGNGKGWQGGRNQGSGIVPSPETSRSASPASGLNLHPQSGKQVNRSQNDYPQETNKADNLLLNIVAKWADLDEKAFLLGSSVISIGLILSLAGVVGFKLETSRREKD